MSSSVRPWFIAFMQAINAFMQAVNAFMQTVNAFMQATSSLRPPRTVLMLTGERLCQNSPKHALYNVFIHCVIVINQDSIRFHRLSSVRLLPLAKMHCIALVHSSKAYLLPTGVPVLSQQRLYHLFVLHLL